MQPRPPSTPSRGLDSGGSRRDYLADRKPDFLLIEFDKLQEEIRDSIAEMWRSERSVAIGVVALLAFGFARSDAPVSPHFFTLPFVITVLAGLRALMLWLHLKRLGNYLTKVEEVFGVHPELGWELRLEKLDESKPFTLAMVAVTIVFWTGTLAVTGVIALGYEMGLW